MPRFYFLWACLRILAVALISPLHPFGTRAGTPIGIVSHIQIHWRAVSQYLELSLFARERPTPRQLPKSQTTPAFAPSTREQLKSAVDGCVNPSVEQKPDPGVPFFRFGLIADVQVFECIECKSDLQKLLHVHAMHLFLCDNECGWHRC